jgi:hypothetical protein
MKKPLIIIVLAALVLIGVVVAGVVITQRNESSVQEDSSRDELRTDGVTEESCVAAHGDWNSCGSACRTTPDAPCIEVCVAYCECVSDTQCPSGLTCSDVVDDVGVCL